MTFKLLGAACVALAAGSTLRTLFITRRHEDRLLQHMALSLDTMAREIRWQHRSIPDILGVLSKDPLWGSDFFKIGEMLGRKIPLQVSWNAVFSETVLGNDVLRNIDLNGDESQMVTSLERGAEEIRKILEERKKQRPEQTKLCTAAALSAAGGLILLLL